MIEADRTSPPTEPEVPTATGIAVVAFCLGIPTLVFFMLFNATGRSWGATFSILGLIGVVGLVLGGCLWFLVWIIDRIANAVGWDPKPDASAPGWNRAIGLGGVLEYPVFSAVVALIAGLVALIRWGARGVRRGSGRSPAKPRPDDWAE